MLQEEKVVESEVKMGGGEEKVGRIRWLLVVWFWLSPAGKQAWVGKWRILRGFAGSFDSV